MATKRSKAKATPRKSTKPVALDPARMVDADAIEQGGDLALATHVRGGGSIVTPAQAERQVDAMLDELHQRNERGDRIYGKRGVDLAAEFPATRVALDSPQGAVWLRAILGKLVAVQRLYRQRDRAKLPRYLGEGIDTRPFDDACGHLKLVASQIMRGKPIAGEADVVFLLDLMSQGEAVWGLRHLLPWSGMVGVVEHFVESNGLTAAVEAARARTDALFFRKKGVILGVDDKKIRARLDALG